MKQTIKTGVFALALILISFRSFSQEQEKAVTPKWVSDKGYWVVESNIHSPLENTVRFYNNDNVQIYKETISGTRINFKKAKVKMKLKQALESAILAWEKNKIPEENKEYVSVLLK
jgi:hypothetical protein